MMAFFVHTKDGRQRLKVELEPSTLTMMAVSDLPGERIVSLPLDKVRVMRLNGPVESQYSQGHYVCTLELEGGESHYIRAELDNPEAVADYGRLIAGLHDQLTRMASPPRFSTGLKSASGFYFFAGVMVLCMGTLAVASVFGMMRKHNYATGIGLISGMGVITYFTLKFAAKILVPKTYDPQSPDTHLVPNPSV